MICRATHEKAVDIVQEYTIFKEATDLLKAMWGKLCDVLVVTEFRVISTDSYDLIIFLTLLMPNDD
jgi:hypothetical protein